MRFLKSHPLFRLINNYIIDSPQPSNLSYLWNFGSLLALCLVIQIITGVTLAMHYNPSVLEAFNSVEHIMRDVNNGWLIRYLHSNTASAFFFIVYLHIGRGLYYGSYRAPRTLVWTIGTVIFILMIVTAFLGYVLPYGQMSLWGATVITNLMSAVPWIGQDIVEFLWGGFSVNNATLNRFFALHFVLPFVLAALALMHLIALHDSAGSGNPMGVSGNYDRLPFAPYFLFKDLITIFIFIIVISLFVFFMPNVLGDSENYVVANPMQTPPAIVPEWYLLPFYAILRSIPNKLLGVVAMLSAILILLAMPFTDLSRSRGIQFRPLSKIAFYVFIANFLVLMVLGAKHVESPFIEFGQISTVLYFAHFLIIVPFVSLFENTLVELGTRGKSTSILPTNSIVVYSGFLSIIYRILFVGFFLVGLGYPLIYDITHIIDLLTSEREFELDFEEFYYDKSGFYLSSLNDSDQVAANVYSTPANEEAAFTSNLMSPSGEGSRSGGGATNEADDVQHSSSAENEQAIWDTRGQIETTRDQAQASKTLVDSYRTRLGIVWTEKEKTDTLREIKDLYSQIERMQQEEDKLQDTLSELVEHRETANPSATTEADDVQHSSSAENEQAIWDTRGQIETTRDQAQASKTLVDSLRTKLDTPLTEEEKTDTLREIKDLSSQIENMKCEEDKLQKTLSELVEQRESPRP